MTLLPQRSNEGWELVAVTGTMESTARSVGQDQYGFQSTGASLQQGGFHLFWKRPVAQPD